MRLNYDINLAKGLDVEKPFLFIPWTINPVEFLKLPGAEKVGGFNTLSLGSIVVFGGKRLKASFHFDAASPNSSLKSIHFGMSQTNITSDYRFFQNHLEKILGKPDVHIKEDAHYDVVEFAWDAWKYEGGVIALHSVSERMMVGHEFEISREKHVQDFVAKLESGITR